MAKRRKSNLLFFLLTPLLIQFIFPSISSPADFLPLSWNSPDDQNLFELRLYYCEPSAYCAHIIDWGNAVLYCSPGKLYLQALYEFRDPCLAKNHLGKSLLIAQNITPNPSPKPTMRTPITPLVLLSEFFVMTTLTDKIVYLLFVLCYSLSIFSWLIKKHPDI